MTPALRRTIYFHQGVVSEFMFLCVSLCSCVYGFMNLNLWFPEVFKFGQPQGFLDPKCHRRSSANLRDFKVRFHNTARKTCGGAFSTFATSLHHNATNISLTFAMNRRDRHSALLHGLIFNVGLNPTFETRDFLIA